MTMTRNSVAVKTDGDNFASIEYGMVLVEFSKDGDSPSCTNSWTYGIWYDGQYLDGTSEEMSFAEAMQEVAYALNGIACDVYNAQMYISKVKDLSHAEKQDTLTLSDLYGIWKDEK